jgi:linoleoyl-CoA desaturase
MTPLGVDGGAPADGHEDPSGLPPAPRRGFGADLNARVHDHLTDEMLATAHLRLHRKGIVVMTWYLSSYVLVLLAEGWVRGIVACVSLALSMVAVGFNVQHDANHNAFFPARGTRRFTLANRLAGLSIHMIGASAQRWIEGHVFRHHSAPNVVGRDADIDLTPFARLAPGQRRRWWHGFQHLYLWVIYAFTTVSVIVGDVVGIVQDSLTHGRTDRKGRVPGLKDYFVLLGSKALFVVAMLVIPLLLHPGWIVALGTVGVLLLSGFLLGVVFQLAHVVEEADFDELAARRDVRWHEWQVRASVDFCPGSGPFHRALTWYCGGLNYQAVHHLFPQLPHTVYPEIAPVVAATCADHGIPYHVHPTLRAAVRSHYRHVRQLGRPVDPPVADTRRAA